MAVDNLDPGNLNTGSKSLQRNGLAIIQAIAMKLIKNAMFGAFLTVPNSNPENYKPGAETIQYNSH